MSDSKHCHPLLHQGASRLGRLVQTLRPDAFQLDERTIQELIVEAHRFARTLRFFDETDTQPAGAYWENFWEVEILTYLAVVAATDTDEIRRQYQELNEQFEQAKEAKPAPGGKKKQGTVTASYLSLLEHLRLLAFSLEDAYQKLVRIKHPLQTLLLNRIRRDSCCDQEELEGALVKLIGYHKGADAGLQMSKYAGFFAPDKRWGLEDRIEYDAIAANPHFNQNDLNELFNTFFNTWLVLKNAAQAGFDAELARMELPEEVEYRIVQPHVVLFLVFLRLFRYAQESLNELGTKHLDFYYEEILGLRRRGEVADEVYLLFELAKDFDQHLLEKGTLFDAGKDKNGQPLLFETIEDWVLRPAQVADLKNTWIDLQCGGIHANPDVKKAYLNGAEKPNESAKFWRSMGDDRQLPDGEVGFAIASPQLILREGKRIIDITLNLINDIAQPEKLKSEYFQVSLSSTEDWIAPEFNPLVVPGSTAIPDLAKGSFGMSFATKTIRIRVVLERDDPPVDSLGEELAAKAGFDTQWPLIKVVINPELEKPCPAAIPCPDEDPDNEAIVLTAAEVYEMLRTLLIGEIVIKVDVRGIRENLIIQSDQGVFDGTQKVFPFGPVPEIGNRFYIGSTEVFQKALDFLQVRFEWIAPPPKFSEHYEDYKNIDPAEYPIPNPKVLIEFIDRAEDKLILITQVLRDGALASVTNPIRLKISDVNFNSDVMTGVTITSVPPGATITPDPTVPGLYDILLPANVNIATDDIFITLSKGPNDDFEPLTIRLDDPVVPAALEVVLFPREKIFDDFADHNQIQGKVKNIYGEALNNATIDGLLVNLDPDGSYVSAKSAIPAPLTFSKTGFLPLSANTQGFSAIDANLYGDFKASPAGSTAFTQNLSGIVSDLKNLPGNLAGVRIVAKNSAGAVLAITKSRTGGAYQFPDVTGVASVDFFFEENEQDKTTANAVPNDQLNATLLPARIIKNPPAGNINIKGTIGTIGGLPLGAVNLEIDNGTPIPVGASFNQPDIVPNAMLEFSGSGYQTQRFPAENYTDFEVIMLPNAPVISPPGTGASSGTVTIAFQNVVLLAADLKIIFTSGGAPVAFTVSGNVATITGFTGSADITIQYPGFEDLPITGATSTHQYQVLMEPLRFSSTPGTADQVKGKIRRPNGDRFPSVRVIATNGTYYFEAITNNAGEFVMHLPAGTTGYKISAIHKTAAGKYLISTPPLPSNPNVEGRDIVMLLGHIIKSRPSEGRVEGTVRGIDGALLSGVKIETGGAPGFSDKTGFYDVVFSSNLKFIHPLYEPLTVNLDDNSDVHVKMIPVKGKALWVFEGIVSDIFGIPLSNVAISIQNADGVFELTRSNADGVYRLTVPDLTVNPVQKVIFELPGFKKVEFDFPPVAAQGTAATLSLMDVRMSYDEINYTPLIENDTIQDKFEVKINALNLVRDIRTQQFEKYSPTLKRGFIRLTLREDDFMHLEYPKMLTWYALYAAGQLNLDLDDDGEFDAVPSPPPIPNPPYTPATNNISLDYTSTQIITGDDNDKIDQYYHLLSFNGHKWIPLEAVKPETEPKVQMIYPYMPDDTLPVTQGGVPRPYAPGNLFIGISDLTPGGALSLLFQIADGTEPQPEALAPAIHWSYLAAGNTWLPFKTGEIIRDNTNGLTRSGIIQYAIPTLAVKENTMLNPEYFWLRAAAKQADIAIGESPTQVQALPSMTNIRAQVVQARFKNQDNDLAHLAQPLPAETIAKLVESRTAVKKVEQPLESSGGKLPESAGLDFYYRVSERLRHKDRAVTVWDYEHLLLEQYPLTAAAKCVQHTRYKPAAKASELAPGYVTVAVIPDLKIRKGEPWPEPRFTQGDLDDMRLFLAARANLCVAYGEKEDAHLQVLNPLYEKVDVLVTVAFMPGVDEAFFKEQLQQELTHYISPWLADPLHPPAFGRTLQRSAILQFIEERPYVDYVDLADPLTNESKFLIRMQVVDIAGWPVAYLGIATTQIADKDAVVEVTRAKSRIISGKICPSTARSILVAGTIIVGSVKDAEPVKLPLSPGNMIRLCPQPTGNGGKLSSGSKARPAAKTPVSAPVSVAKPRATAGNAPNKAKTNK